MNNELVSVVIPNYNYGHYLGAAIDSVLAQTYPNVEVIVVDDGSTDDSQEVLLAYGSALRTFSQVNQGVSAARNRGILESRGEFIAFLDADDLWAPEKLSQQLRLFTNRRLGLVYSGLQYIDDNSQPIGTSVTGVRGRVLQEIALLKLNGAPAIGSSAVVRRECFETVGMFDPALSTSADWDLLRRIAGEYEVDFVAQPLVLYRLHACSMHQNPKTMECDTLCAFAKMFADPSACEVHPFSRRCYGRLYMVLSGCYLHAGDFRSSIKFALRSISTWPPSVSHVGSYPWRLLRRRFESTE